MSEIIARIIADLESRGDESVRVREQNYFKESVTLHGLSMPAATKLGESYFASVRDRGKTEILDLCDELWRTGYLEESYIACGWSYAIHRQYEEGDLDRFEGWLSKYVSNWASCDTLCNHTIGSLVEMYPGQVTRLRGWAQSENRWLRRGAAVTLIIPARRGMFLDDIVAIADTLLMDGDDLVQKGYGWMLKAASQAHPAEVFQYVMRHRAKMPRTALRYAIEKLPVDLRKQAMERE
jgi:3-methyladenine DNA glycosylase AlkD